MLTMIFRELSATFPGQEMWGAQAGNSSYIIVKDDGLYTASARTGRNSRTAHVIPYEGAVMTFDEAKDACERHYNRC